MRREHAQPARAARKRTVAPLPKSARAEPARVLREAPFLNPSESAAFAPLCVGVDRAVEVVVRQLAGDILA
jgi:hypothetical protein